MQISGVFRYLRLLGIEGRLEANKDKKIVPYKERALRLSPGLITDDEDTALMWRGLMLSKALEQFLFDVAWGNLDYLVIDLPPGTGDIQMALGRLLPQTELVVITTPQLSAQKVATRVADMAKGVLYRFWVLLKICLILSQVMEINIIFLVKVVEMNFPKNLVSLF